MLLAKLKNKTEDISATFAVVAKLKIKLSPTGNKSSQEPEKPLRYILDGKLNRDLEKPTNKKLPDIVLCPNKGVNQLTCKCSHCDKISPTDDDFKLHLLTQNQRNMLTDYIHLMEEMQRLKEIYFEEFLNALQTMILQQEKLMDSEGTKMVDIAACTNRHAFVPLIRTRLAAKENVSDKFLEQIVSLQKKFISQGKIRTPEDMDKFWKDVQKPDFQSVYLSTAQESPHNRSTHGMSSGESSDITLPNDDDHWAVVQAKQRKIIKQVNRQESWAGRRTTPKAIKSQISKKKNTPGVTFSFAPPPSYLESKPFPVLYCMRQKSDECIDVSSKKLANMEASQHSRKKNRRLVEKMSQLALTNQVLTNRLLQRHGDDLAFSLDSRGAQVSDILQQFPNIPAEPCHEPDNRTHHKPTRIATDLSPKQYRERSMSEYLQMPITTLREITNQKTVKKEPIDVPDEPLDAGDVSSSKTVGGQPKQTPLTMGALTEELRTMTAKGPSSWWQNYTKNTVSDDSHS